MTFGSGPGHGRMLWGALIIGALVVAAVLAVAAESLPYDYWGALLLLPVAVFAGVFLTGHAARSFADDRVARLIPLAIAVNLLGALGRYVFLLTTYGGIGDSTGYSARGSVIADALRSGTLDLSVARRLPGTGIIDVFTGVLYTALGPSLLGGFLIYALLGILGRYLFLLALRTAVPDANHYRYALLVFLLPALVFWNGAIGKEAWMTVGLGACFFGAARLHVREIRPGAVWLLGGLVVTSVVRSHIALLVLVSLLVAPLLAQRLGSALRPQTAFRAVGMVAVGAAIGLWGLRFLQRRIGTGDGFLDLEHMRAEVLDMTGRGGSAFLDGGGSSLLVLPADFLGVFVRPVPWEADSIQALITSAEGLLLVGLIILAFRRAGLRPLALAVHRHRYATMCAIYTALFGIAFTAIANFGILARQRVQVWPILFVLLVLPVVQERSIPNGDAQGTSRARPEAIAVREPR